MSKKFIIANWKANPSTIKEAILLAQKIEEGISSLRNVDVIIAPPFPFLVSVRDVIKKARIGAQNMFWKDIGPYTGEVSWRQLKTIGVSHVIIGHSERKLLGESDDMINKKVQSALANGMTPILCVVERERAGGEIPALVGEQLKSALYGVEKKNIKNLVVAYEPIWAISTTPDSRPDTSDNAFRAMLYIRKVLTGLSDRKSADLVRIIYGGSVNSKNIFSFIDEGKMEGALVGGASLDAKEFIEIVKRAAERII